MTNQEGHVLSFSSDAIDDGDLKLVRMRGREAVGELYEFELILANDGLDEPLGFDRAQGLLRDGLVQIEFAGGGGAMAGMVRAFEFLPAADLPRSTYRAIVVPRLWLTTRTGGSAIYQRVCVPDIIALVLDRVGVEEYEIKLSGDHPEREYVVQYEETDYNFLVRLMEDEGIYYRFEFEVGGCGERLIFLDDNDMAGEDGEHGAIRYIPAKKESPEGGAMQSLSCRQRVHTSKVVRRDHVDQDAPAYVEGEGEAQAAARELIVTRHGGSLVDESVASARGLAEAESYQAEGMIFAGETTCAWLRSGFKVEIDDRSLGGMHPDFPCDLLITAVEHDWDENRLYRNTFTAIDVATPFRARRRAHRPRIPGVIHGRIVGESPGSELPWLDEQGRYLVQYLFPNAAEASQISRYTRMAQPLAGASCEGNYGIHFPLHAGVEVLVAHVDGDPDRPVIVGSVPNPDTPSPVTSVNSSHNIIKTRSGIVMAFVDLDQE